MSNNNNFDPVKEKHETHEKLIDRFGSIEAYFEFVLKRQEEQIKQGEKYVYILVPSRQKTW